MSVDIPLMLIQLAGLVFSIVVHEVAHGYAAWRLGDPTAHLSNRLTLNPLKHIDPIGSVVLPLLLVLMPGNFLFGWAKPVPFNPAYFRDPRKGIMIVGAAGPASNLLLAVGGAILFRVVAPFWPEAGWFLYQLCRINVFLAVLNLIPIPPLDGSRIVMGFLRDRLLESYMQLERYGFVIVLVLLFVGHLDRGLHEVVSLLMALLFLGA